MIKVSLGVKKKEGGSINIDFEPVSVKSRGNALKNVGISKLYQNCAFDEDTDDTGNRKYLGEIHFSDTSLTQWRYLGTHLGDFELKQLMRYFKKYGHFQADNF